MDSREPHARFSKQQSCESRQARPRPGAQLMMNSRTRAEEQKDSRCGHHISSLNKNLNSFRLWFPLPWPRAKGIGRLSDGYRLALAQWWRFRVPGPSARVSLAWWALSAGRSRARRGPGGSGTEGVPRAYAGAAAGGGGRSGCLFHFFRDVAEAVIRRVVGGRGRSGAAGGGKR